MFDTGNPVLWVISSIVLVAFFFLVRGFFSAEARERRRRERSHRSVISQKKGPAVRLAVDVAKPKRDRTR